MLQYDGYFFAFLVLVIALSIYLNIKNDKSDAAVNHSEEKKESNNLDKSNF